MRRHFVSHPGHYVDHYTRQVGRGYPVFRGAPTQKGFGLGNILGGLFRTAMPLLKQGAKTLGRQALRTGLGIAQDALEGKNIKSAAQSRLKQTGRHMARRAIQNIDSRLTPKARRGIKRKRNQKRATSTSRKRPRRTPDIFD